MQKHGVFMCFCGKGDCLVKDEEDKVLFGLKTLCRQGTFANLHKEDILRELKEFYGDESIEKNKKIKNWQDVAQYFLYKNKIDPHGEIRLRKLNILLYYAQGWNLTFCNKPLFNGRFLAGIHGPYIVETYKKYSKHRYENLPFKLPEWKNVEKFFNEENVELLELIWATYGKCDEEYLEALIHSEEAWLNAREYNSGDLIFEKVISQRSMKKYFKKKWKEHQNVKQG